MNRNELNSAHTTWTSGRRSSHGLFTKHALSRTLPMHGRVLRSRAGGNAYVLSASRDDDLALMTIAGKIIVIGEDPESGASLVRDCRTTRNSRTYDLGPRCADVATYSISRHTTASFPAGEIRSSLRSVSGTTTTLRLRISARGARDSAIMLGQSNRHLPQMPDQRGVTVLL